MEQHPFSLTSALDSWKRRLRHGRGVTDDDLAELESHLHDSMAELRHSGLSEEESFMIASHRLGDVRTLAAELSENKPPPIPEASGGAAQREPHHSPHSEKTTSGFWSFSLKLLGVLLLLAGTGALIVYNLLEKKYVGRVKMLVHQPKQRPSMPTSSAGSIPVEMEFRIITGAETLRLVVQEKGLTKRWALGTDENAAIERLTAMVEPTFERGTNLISLAAYSPNPEEAAELANAVAAAYQRRRNEYEKSRSLEMLDTLENEEESQKKKVEEKRVAMLEVMKKYEIVDLDGPQGGGQNSARLALELEERINRLKYVTTLPGDKLMEQYPLPEGMSLTMKEFLPQQQRIRLLIAECEQQGLGQKHPKMVGLRAQRAKLQEILAEAVEALRQRLTSELKVLTETLANHKQGKAGSTDRDAQLNYATAKREYEQQSELVAEMQEHTMQMKADLAMPSSVVQIHEPAFPDQNPAGPNLWVFMRGGVAAVLLGLISLIFGFAVNRRGRQAQTL